MLHQEKSGNPGDELGFTFSSILDLAATSSPFQMDCEVVFRYEDVDYIYSLAVRNPTSWVASGEHIGLRVFDNGEVRNDFKRLRKRTFRILNWAGSLLVG
jgi:hypothetical protein